MSDPERYRRREEKEKRMLAKINRQEHIFLKRERDRSHRREERRQTFPKKHHDESLFRKRAFENRKYYEKDEQKRLYWKRRRENSCILNRLIWKERERLRLIREELEREKMELERLKREKLERDRLDQRRQEKERKRAEEKEKIEMEKLRQAELKRKERSRHLSRSPVTYAKKNSDKKKLTIAGSRRLGSFQRSRCLEPRYVSKPNGRTEVGRHDIRRFDRSSLQRPAVRYYSPTSAKSTDLNHRDTEKYHGRDFLPSRTSSKIDDGNNRREVYNNGREISGIDSDSDTFHRGNLPPILANIAERYGGQNIHERVVTYKNGDYVFINKNNDCEKRTYSSAYGQSRYDSNNPTHSTTPPWPSYRNKSELFWKPNDNYIMNASKSWMMRNTGSLSLLATDAVLTVSPYGGQCPANDNSLYRASASTETETERSTCSPEMLYQSLNYDQFKSDDRFRQLYR